MINEELQKEVFEYWLKMEKMQISAGGDEGQVNAMLLQCEGGPYEEIRQAAFDLIPKLTKELDFLGRIIADLHDERQEAARLVELSLENALMKKALDRLLASYKDGSIHDCLAMDLVKLVDAVTFCDQVRKTVK
jgi:hypothetical protein